MPEATLTSQPAVSVLVTVFNRERFLQACLESILVSTWTDFEIIVVDDCSIDSSAEIAAEFAGRDPRIKFFRNDSNLGDYPNRMRAAELAKGKYLKFVDSDDVIYPHGLRVMVEAMESHGDAALGLSHSRPEDEKPYPWQLSPAEAWRKEFIGDGCMGCGPSGAIIDRDKFFEAGGFHDHGVLSDTEMWYRMSAKWPIVLLPPGLVWWRRHDGQEFTTGDAGQRYLEDGFRVTEACLASGESPLDAADTAIAMSRARQHHARRLLALALNRGRAAEGLRLWRSAGFGISDIVHGLKRYK